MNVNEVIAILQKVKNKELPLYIENCYGDYAECTQLTEDEHEVLLTDQEDD